MAHPRVRWQCFQLPKLCSTPAFSLLFPHLLLAIAVSGMLQLGIAVFPFTQHVFDVLPHTMFEWIAIVVLALMPMTFIELGKLFWGSVYQVKSPPPQMD